MYQMSKSRIGAVAVLFAFGSLLSAEAMAVEGVTLSPRTTGHFKTNFKYMVDGAASESVTIPIPFYVIRHPEGIVLFDSGLGADFQNQIRGWWVHQIFQLMLPSQFIRSDAAVYQLDQRGIPPQAIRYIIVSHLHYDHAGGLLDFPNATVVVSRGEWENANVGRWRARLRGVMSEQLKGIENRLWLIDYLPGTAVGPFDASFDLFGDGSLVLISTPGHTPGHQSLLVTLESGNKVLLTGDAVWVRENYQRPAPKGWVVRLLEEKADEAWEMTLKIKKFAEENPQVVIIPGHDPQLWGELPTEMK